MILWAEQGTRFFLPIMPYIAVQKDLSCFSQLRFFRSSSLLLALMIFVQLVIICTVPARLTLRCSKIAGSKTHSVQYNMPSCVLQDFLLLIILLCLLCFRTLSDPCCRLGWSDFWQTNWKLVSWSKRKFLTNKKCTFLRFLWFWKYNLCRARDQICRFF